MDPGHESGPWTWSKVGVHGPLVHVLSSPSSSRFLNCYVCGKNSGFRYFQGTEAL